MFRAPQSFPVHRCISGVRTGPCLSQFDVSPRKCRFRAALCDAPMHMGGRLGLLAEEAKVCQTWLQRGLWDLFFPTCSRRALKGQGCFCAKDIVSLNFCLRKVDGKGVHPTCKAPKDLESFLNFVAFKHKAPAVYGCVRRAGGIRSTNQGRWQFQMNRPSPHFLKCQ